MGLIFSFLNQNGNQEELNHVKPKAYVISEHGKLLMAKWEVITNIKNKTEYSKSVCEFIEEANKSLIYVNSKYMYTKAVYTMLYEYRGKLRINDVNKVKKIVQQFEETNLNVFQLDFYSHKDKLMFHLELSNWYRNQHNLEYVFYTLNAIVNYSETMRIENEHDTKILDDTIASLIHEITEVGKMKKEKK